MLEKCGIISKRTQKNKKGLNEIYKDIEEGKLLIEGDYEDIHSFIELNLTERIGTLVRSYILLEAEMIKWQWI